jgi:hypothetical protein
MSTIIAIFWGVDEKIIEFIIIPAAVLFNFLIIWLKSYFDANAEQSLIRSFLTNDLLPTNLGKPLEFQAKIVIIEDETSHGSFIKSVDKLFKGKNEPATHNLILVPFSCETSNVDAQRARLSKSLEGANAVVVIRTKELEEKSWAYEVVQTWAYARSDVPILFTELDKDSRKSLIPDNYFSIPADTKSLPWRLVQRANERGLVWRNVASFNRLIATNFIILLIMSFSIGHYLISHQQKEDENIIRSQQQETSRLAQSLNHSLHNQQEGYYDLLGEIYQGGSNNAVIQKLHDGIAQRTKEQFENFIMKSKDDKFVVSYWVRDENKLRQFGTTDKDPNRTDWDFDKTTVIGCAFSNTNHFAIWDAESNSNEPEVISLNGVKLQNHGCHFWDRPSQDIRSIVCASYNSSSDSQNKSTAGICIFTENPEREKNVSKYDYSEFLKEKTKKFYEFAFPYIENNKIVPLVKKLSEKTGKSK